MVACLKGHGLSKLDGGRYCEPCKIGTYNIEASAHLDSCKQCPMVGTHCDGGSDIYNDADFSHVVINNTWLTYECSSSGVCLSKQQCGSIPGACQNGTNCYPGFDLIFLDLSIWYLIFTSVVFC